MENTNVNENNGVKASPTDSLIKDADAVFAERIKTGQYKDLLDAMQNIGDYSLRNQMLILKQNPGATNVNGMKAWNYRKRSIRSGEKSIKIIAPKFAKEVTMDDNGDLTEKTLDKVIGYEVHYVFDIAQTEGEPLKIMRITPPLLENYYDVAANALKGTVKGYEFKTAEDMGKNVTSILDTESRTITMRSDMDKEAMLRTLISQVAAANIMAWNRRNFQGLPGNRLGITAAEQSAISYIVCNRLGLSTEKLREPEFGEFEDGDIEKFANNIGIVRSVSQKMIMAVEDGINYQIYKEKEAAASQENTYAVETTPTEPVITDVKPKKETTVKKSATKQRTKSEAVM